MLIKKSDMFNGVPAGGSYFGKERPFVLKNGLFNLYEPIRNDALVYFKENGISWWGGYRPSGHVLSSQIACLNHLFLLRHDGKAVLSILNNVRNEFTEILPIPCDKEPTYIAFEVVSDKDHLNEGTPNRGSNCTSIDAFIYARHRSGELWLIPIEWKYTEHYSDQDKSNEDRSNEGKGSNGKGKERLRRYNDLITESAQLKTVDEYSGSLYYFEPFYQLMRQTLWAENMIKHKDTERLKADNYLHVHIIPPENDELLYKKYKQSDDTMENSWRAMLTDQSKYIIISPEMLLAPIASEYPELIDYLSTRYWDRNFYVKPRIPKLTFEEAKQLLPDAFQPVGNTSCFKHKIIAETPAGIIAFSASREYNGDSNWISSVCSSKQAPEVSHWVIALDTRGIVILPTDIAISFCKDNYVPQQSPGKWTVYLKMEGQKIVMYYADSYKDVTQYFIPYPL